MHSLKDPSRGLWIHHPDGLVSQFSVYWSGGPWQTSEHDLKLTVSARSCCPKPNTEIGSKWTISRTKWQVMSMVGVRMEKHTPYQTLSWWMSGLLTHLGLKICPYPSGWRQTYKIFSPNSSGRRTHLWGDFWGSWLIHEVVPEAVMALLEMRLHKWWEPPDKGLVIVVGTIFTILNGYSGVWCLFT